MAIHPDGRKVGPYGIATRAESVPQGIEAVFPLLDDPSMSVREGAIWMLAAYIGLGDARVDGAMRKALADPKHKIVHYAARYLGIACPGCGKPPLLPTKRGE